MLWSKMFIHMYIMLWSKMFSVSNYSRSTLTLSLSFRISAQISNNLAYNQLSH